MNPYSNNYKMNHDPLPVYTRAYNPGYVEDGAQERLQYLWDNKHEHLEDCLAFTAEWVLDLDKDKWRSK